MAKKKPEDKLVHHISRKGRENIAAAQRKRWAKWRREQKAALQGK